MVKRLSGWGLKEVASALVALGVLQALKLADKAWAVLGVLGKHVAAFLASPSAPYWFIGMGVFAGLAWAAWPSIHLPRTKSEPSRSDERSRDAAAVHRLPADPLSTGGSASESIPAMSAPRTVTSPLAPAYPNPSAENAASKLARRIRRFVSTRAPRQDGAPPPLPNYDALDEDYDYFERMGAEFVHSMAQQRHDEFPARLASDFIFRFQRDVADVHALFSRIGVRDDALDRLLFDDHAFTLNSHQPTAPETMLAIADRFDALAAKPQPRPDQASTTLLARVVARNGTPVDQAAVITVSPEGIGGDLVHADERGVAQLSVPAAAGYTVLVAHPDYVGASAPLDLDQDAVAEITLEARDGYSSTIIQGGYGEIPGLKGHLNPSDGDDHMSLYAIHPDIAINGGKDQPVRFALNEELTLKDAVGAVFLVRFKFIKNRTSLVQDMRG